MKKVFRTLSLVCCFLFPAQGHSSSESDTEVLASYRFKSKTDFSAQVGRAFRDPNAVSVDFSRVLLNDEDLLTIVLPAIVSRSSIAHPETLDLLNLGNGKEGGVSYGGVLRFLEELQKAGRSGHALIFSILEGAVLKTGLPITEEFVDNVQKSASLLIAKELKVIE